MSDVGLLSVDKLYAALKLLLYRAREIKPNGGIEPALTSASFSGDIEKVTREAEGGFGANAQENYAALETACRSIFYDILVGYKGYQSFTKYQ